MQEFFWRNGEKAAAYFLLLLKLIFGFSEID